MKVQVLFKYNIVIILMVLLTLYFNHNKLFSSSEEPIAFVMKDDSKNDEIFIINPVAGNISQYTKHRLQPRELIWSPTREYIAFIGSSKPGVTTDLESLYLLNTTNKQISKLIDFKFPASHGGWSLDGTKLYWILESRQIRRILVFQENQLKEEHKDITLQISPFPDRSVKFQLFDGLERSNYEIVLIENGTKNRLTTNKIMDTFPALSPNGQNIAFVSEINSLPQIVVVNLSGQNSQVLTKFTNNRFPRMLAWAPAIAWVTSSARKTSSHE